MANGLSRWMTALGVVSLISWGCASDPARKLDDRVTERDEKLDEFQRKEAELKAEQRMEAAKLEREQATKQAELRSDYSETLSEKDQKVVEASVELQEDYEKTMARFQERIDTLDARLDEINRKAGLASQDKRARVLPKLSEARRLHEDLINSKKSAANVTVPVWDEYKARVEGQISRADEAAEAAASEL